MNRMKRSACSNILQVPEPIKLSRSNLTKAWLLKILHLADLNYL